MPGAVRIGPFLLDQAPAAGQQRGGYHDPVQSQVPGQQPRSMPQYQDLYVFGGVAAGEQRHPAEQPDHEQAEEADKHDRRG
jgi:hypothetical protein